MRRRLVARVAPLAALALLLAGVVLCPARCLAGDVPTQAAPPPCHHDAGSAPADPGSLPPSAHATCCVAAVAPSTASAPVSPLVAITPAVLPVVLLAPTPAPAGAARSVARGAPPGPLYLRLRTLLV